jgi:nucleoside-diphosphate-sugar epimerase
MKVLVTGGTGIIGQGVIKALLHRQHEVRVLSRHASRDVKQWDERVESFKGDVSDRSSIEGSMGGCDVAIHIVGIIRESPPGLTFQSVNVEGTRNVVAEAERVGLRRIVFVSSLGADRGTTGYHQSKFAAEKVIEQFSRQWLIVRPGLVYGPGDDVVSTLFTMIRTLPAIPILGDGTDTFQPIWYEDLGEALVNAAERTELNHRILEVAGEELTTMFDLAERVSSLLDRWPARINIPRAAALAGARLSQFLGVDLPVDETNLRLLMEENYIEKAMENALTRVLGVQPTPLDEGLRRLETSMPENLPSEGVGPMRKKEFSVVIQGSRYNADELAVQFRTRFPEVMPVKVGNGPTGASTLEVGTTINGSLPLRGDFQVRVEKVTPRDIVVATVQGHPQAGIVHFVFEQWEDRVRFLIEVFSRASDFVDALLLQTFGGVMQSWNWTEVAHRVVDMTGGTAPEGVREHSEILNENDARSVEEWIEEMVMTRRREENAPTI